MTESSSSSSTKSSPNPSDAKKQNPDSSSAADVSDIRFTILSHLFILCICDGFYDSRSRSLLRAVASHLNIEWWAVAKLEDTISEQLRIQDSESNENESVKLESSIISERNKKDSQGRWLYMGLATLAGGAVSGVTAGLAAPLIASGIASALTTFHVAGGVGAGVTAFMGGSTGIAIIASSGASIGGGMTGYKMHKRTKGILEFEFIGLDDALKRDKNAEKEKKALDAAAAASASAGDTTTVLFDLGDAENNDETDSSNGGTHSRGNSAIPLVVLDETATPSRKVASSNVVDKRMEVLQATGCIHRRRASNSSLGSVVDRPSRDLGRDFSVSRELNREISAPILFSNTPPVNEDGDASGDASGGESTPSATPKANVLITIAGWVGSLDSRDDFTLPFSTLTPGVHGEQYALVWETQALIELGHAVRLLMSEITGFLVQQGIQYFLLPVLMAGLTGPLWALKLTYMVDNPWGNGLTKAKKAGRILADTLLSRVQGNRPVTLIGFSLGARVIYYCLLELASRGEAAFSVVEEAYLFGTPVMATTKEWKAIASVVSGRLVNGYITNDYILSMLYRASSAFLADVAGLNPVKGVEGIENYNLDTVLKGGHLEYRSAMPRILKHVGFSVDDEFFDDGEKEAEQARLDEEKEKERIKNDKERAKEEAARKKQEEYEERIRKKKEEDEARRVEAEAKKAEAVAKKLQAELAAKNAPRRTWFFGRSSVTSSSSSSSLAATGSTEKVVEAVEELPFEIKEIKSTLPPLVVSLDNVATTSTNVSPYDADGSLI
ncbi:UNVERIFIED_CONTAM: hypothetical protein HDU68_006751 [Siphonaria sp. JEL0065]|nr:hypothetical protein HDU68_006751 [Siphonaria sp. JEL0065]